MDTPTKEDAGVDPDAWAEWFIAAAFRRPDGQKEETAPCPLYPFGSCSYFKRQDLISWLAANFYSAMEAVREKYQGERDMTDYRTLSGAAFQRTVRDDPDKWADAAMIAAEDLGYKIERDWLRSLLADAMEAARKNSIREVIEGDNT